MENPDIPTSHFVAVRSANLDTFYRIQQPKYTSEVRLMNNFLTEGKKKKNMCINPFQSNLLVVKFCKNLLFKD